MSVTSWNVTSSKLAELIRGAVGKDNRAFAELYHLYSDKIYRYAYRLVGNRQEAEDITSQTFLNAWQAIGRFEVLRAPGQFQGWLMRIAHNLAIDSFRSPGRQTLVDVADHDTATVSPEGMAERSEQSRDLWAAIERLPQGQREVIVLRFIVGMDHTSVARATGRSVAAVRVLQHRGLLGLRRIMSEE